MSDDCFVDSCVAIYALDPNSNKRDIAAPLLKGRPYISTQVVLETVNVLMKKLGYGKHNAFEQGRFLMRSTRLVYLTDQTMLHGFTISERYQLSHWDSMIVEAAVEAGCETLYSEDLKHGQVIEVVTIQNPFLRLG